MKVRALLVAMLMTACAGCADIVPSKIFHPGPAWYQQKEAEVFDPYPATDIGPEVVGGRPLAYMRPAPENERVQNAATFADRFRQPPPPGLYRPPRDAVAPQGVPFVPAPMPAAGPPPIVQPGVPFAP